MMTRASAGGIFAIGSHAEGVAIMTWMAGKSSNNNRAAGRFLSSGFRIDSRRTHSTVSRPDNHAAAWQLGRA